jgi:hypothetical protein
MLYRPAITVFNAMTMVAVTAVGLVISRAYIEDVDSNFRPRPLGLALLAIIPCLTLWSLAVLVLSFRPLRSRRLTIGPGLTTCIAAVVGAAISTLNAFILLHASPPWKHWRYPGDRLLFHAVLGAPSLVATAVLATWLSLWLGGRWERETDWRGRIGLLLGLCWLLAYVIWELTVLGPLYLQFT